MSLNDPLANAMSKIMNAERVHKTTCDIKNASNSIKKILDILKDNQYVGEYEVIDENNKVSLTLNLLGKVNKCGAIKPRFSVKKDEYEKYEKRFLIAKDFGILIVSTSLGIMTHIDAKKKNVGGKLLAYAY